MANINPHVAWALTSGLAFGYIFGNLAPMHGGGSSRSASEDHATADVSGIGAGSAGAKRDAIPADWLTEDQFGATDAFAGLTPDQRYLALKVLNTKPCDCGCPHGSIAKCKKEDPACPVAPKEIEIATQQAKAGKTYEEIVASVQKPAVAPGGPQQEPKPYKMTISDSTPVRGPKHAKVTIVMFSDFQCPFCSRVEPTLKQVMDTYGNDVRIAWRNEPLPFHPFAMGAAEAAMAADAQGKFWPMHDELFANQSALDRASLEKYAADIGLDMNKFKAAMDQHTYQKKIEDDAKAGGAAGVNGTPAFFVNGQFINGAQPFSDFKRVIDAELAKANDLVKAGTPLDKIYQAELDALPAQ